MKEYQKTKNLSNFTYKTVFCLMI